MENKTKKHWKIECSRGMKVLFQEEIPATQISENRIKRMMSFLLDKYALTDAELIEQYRTVPFKKAVKFYEIIRRQSENNGRLHISFSAEASSISVTATLIER